MVGPLMHHTPAVEHAAGRRETLARVTRQLETTIGEAGLRNPPRLPSERELATTFGVSRSTVREAIQRLIAKGLLEARQGRGLFVRGASPPAALEELALFAENPAARSDTLEFRLVVECAAARLAAERASDCELQEMDALLQRMSDAVRAGDVKAEALADTQFHAALVRASHNRMLGWFYTDAASMLNGHIVKNTLEASGIDTALHRLASARLAQHRAICDAVRARRPDAASEAMRAHIEFVGRQFEHDADAGATAAPDAA